MLRTLLSSAVHCASAVSCRRSSMVTLCWRTGDVRKLPIDVAQFDVRSAALAREARGLGQQRRRRVGRGGEHAAVVHERQRTEELPEQPAPERHDRQHADDAATVASSQVDRFVAEHRTEHVAPVPRVVRGGVGMSRDEGIPVGAAGFDGDCQGTCHAGATRRSRRSASGGPGYVQGCRSCSSRATS